MSSVYISSQTMASLAIFVGILSLSTTGGQDTGIAHRGFEYKYSFKGPYLSQKNGAVPFWDYSGSAIASEDMVRITPSLRSKKGAIWSKYQTNFQWWEVEIEFKVNGRGRLGADGLAFWYTSEKLPEGDTFGSVDSWVGLGLFFDSFDNDNRNNNPYILAMLNDGTKKYDHPSDGISQQLAGCQRDFRNKPFPVKAKIEYFKNVLTVQFHSGNTNSEEDYEMCLRAENVVLPVYGFFGISAATGGLADDHDVLKVSTTSLYDASHKPQANPYFADKDKEKFNKEYDTYKAKLDHQKEEYQKQHPDAHPQETEQVYESQQNLEMRQIFEAQSHMYDGLKHIDRKLDEMLGRQERTLSMVSMVQQGGQQQPIAVQPGFVQPQVVLPIQRHEVEAILAAQRDLLTQLENVRRTIDAAQKHGGNEQPNAAAIDPRLIAEMRDTINVIKRDVASVTASGAQMRDCPKVSCLGPGLFLAFTCLNLAVLLGYMVYRNSKANATKKFY